MRDWFINSTFMLSTYLETTAVRILAVEPVYSLTILSKYLSIDATTTPPKEVNKTAIISKTKIFSSKPGKKNNY